MKIKPEHMAYLRAAIRFVDTPSARADYRAGNFPRAALCKDANKRYRWACLNAAVASSWVCDTLYTYLTDEHIDTALRSIVRPLGE